MGENPNKPTLFFKPPKIKIEISWHIVAPNKYK